MNLDHLEIEKERAKAVSQDPLFICRDSIYEFAHGR